ncbi:TolC family protein [Danxiaibacter flavus]|uniref:TolC family protein n=1 Tax=Danxiaibacter flavus TaxID=3049108 RepID=A0ABV3ZJ20_9BACT|nr:TolC family protein [Chitinophagaceae bacterium DXS]
MKLINSIILTSILLIGSLTSFGQQNKAHALSMQDAFVLAAKNSAQLKVSKISTALAHQKVEIAKLGRLPEISTGLNYGYLSNSQIWDPSFGKHLTRSIPHNLTQFSVQASEVIFRGGEVANNLKKANLEEQIAVLNQNKSLEDIKFLVAAKYLDIYRLINQREVYVDNIESSQERLKNILSLQKQGLVTNNDVLRTKLIISDLQLAVRKTDDNIEIINQQFNTVLGIDLYEKLIPDSSLLTYAFGDEDIKKLMTMAYENNKELKTVTKEIEAAQTNMKVTSAERYPRVSLFAANNLQRPYTYSTPALDIYYNNWIAGVSVSYNISSIYQSVRKIKAAQIQIEQAVARDTVQQQNVEVAVNADLIKFNEAKYELTTYTDDLRSAEENYRIVEKKYFNQLALLADLIDATNTKIEAELKVSNARINAVYAHYQLQKSIGLL